MKEYSLRNPVALKSLSKSVSVVNKSLSLSDPIIEKDFTTVFTAEPDTLNIISVAAQAPVTVAFETAFASVVPQLPAQVQVTLEDLSTTNLNVTWLEGPYDENTPGEYTLFGTLVLTPTVTNTLNLQAEIDVTVNYIQQAVDLFQFADDEGYTPDANILKYHNFFVSIRDSGVLAKSIQGLVFKTTGDSDFKTINLVNVNAFQALKINSPTSSNDGFVSDGVASYLSSEVTLNDLTQDNVTYCNKGIVNSALGVRTLFGAEVISGTILIFCNPRNPSNQMTYNVSDPTNSPVANADARNRMSIARSGGTKYSSINGSAFAPISVAVSNLPTTRRIYILAVDTGVGGPARFNVGGSQYHWVFNQKLTDTEQADFDTAISTLLAAA